MISKLWLRRWWGWGGGTWCSSLQGDLIMGSANWGDFTMWQVWLFFARWWINIWYFPSSLRVTSLAAESLIWILFRRYLPKMPISPSRSCLRVNTRWWVLIGLSSQHTAGQWLSGAELGHATLVAFSGTTTLVLHVEWSHLRLIWRLTTSWCLWVLDPQMSSRDLGVVSLMFCELSKKKSPKNILCQKSHLRWEFHAETLYVCPKLWAHVQNFSLKFSYDKYDFCNTQISREYFKELMKR